MAKRKRKKRGINFKRIFIMLFLFAIGIGIVYYVLQMPIRNIYIKGNKIVNDDEIISLSGLDSYPSFLLTSSKDIKRNIRKNKYIEKVSIKKKFGNIVVISVIEYRMIALNKENKIILSNGVEIDNVYDISDVPVLINEILDKDVYKLFAYKLGKVDSDILREVSEIEYSPVEVDKNRFLLYMNDGNLVYITLTKSEKLNKYNSILDKLGDKKGTIYLDAGDYMEVRS